MTVDDFTGPALAAGTVLGVRAFGIDRLGRLRGVAHADVFRPGENVARCRAAPEGRWTHGPSGITWTADETSAHRPGSAECGCGYWAHYDGTHSYEAPARATAIIEGYGLVTLGTSGFRAGKARLVALVPPSHLPVAARVADLYGAAGVPIYRTLADALTEHPVTHPRRDPLPHPDTHPGFWDRDDRPRVDSDMLPQVQMQVVINRMLMSVQRFGSGAVIASHDLRVYAAPTPKGKRPPRPGHGDTTKTYPTSSDNLRRKGKRR